MAAKKKPKKLISEKEFLDGVRAVIRKVYDRGDDATWEVVRFQMRRLGKKRFGTNDNDSKLEDIFLAEKTHVQEAYTHQLTEQLKKTPKPKKPKAAPQKSKEPRPKTKNQAAKKSASSLSNSSVDDDDDDEENDRTSEQHVVPGSVHTAFMNSQDATVEFRENIYEYLRAEFEAGRSPSFKVAMKTVKKAAVASGIQVDDACLKQVFDEMSKLFQDA